MKDHWKQPLKTYEGTDVKDEDGKPITLGRAAILALLAPRQEIASDGPKKFACWKAALAIEEGRDLDSDAVATIREAVGAVSPPAVLGRIWELLDGKASEL